MNNTPSTWKNSIAHDVPRLLDEVRDLYYWQAKNILIETKITDKKEGKWCVSDILLMKQHMDAKEKARFSEILLGRVTDRFERIFEAVGFAGLEQLNRDIHDALYAPPPAPEKPEKS